MPCIGFLAWGRCTERFDCFAGIARLQRNDDSECFRRLFIRMPPRAANGSCGNRTLCLTLHLQSVLRHGFVACACFSCTNPLLQRILPSPDGSEVCFGPPEIIPAAQNARHLAVSGWVALPSRSTFKIQCYDHEKMRPSEGPETQNASLLFQARRRAGSALQTDAQRSRQHFKCQPIHSCTALRMRAARI